MSDTAPMGIPERIQRRRPHIFVINGVPAFLNLMRDLLQDGTYNVTTTNFVPATFAQVAAAHPDVLVIDLAVGQQAGWALLEALHADAATAGLPVIVLSTVPEFLDRARALAARYGALALLGKPFAVAELLALITAALDRPAAEGSPSS